MTIRHAAEIDPGAVLRTDVCVIGSGPAGLTLAMELASRSVDVVVLESGERDVTETTRDLDLGTVVGQRLHFSGWEFDTTQMRLRALGGASGHWTGMCHPLDAIDLQRRPWIPGSGWPIDIDELYPWYRPAEATLELGTTGWDPQAWFDRTGTRPLIGSERMDTTVHQFSPPVAFATTFADILEDPSGPSVVLGATAVDVGLGPGGGHIDTLTAARLDGASFEVHADTYVLAAGGLEVPRLLLAWGQGSAGVANSSGLVGVGYMEHPHRQAGDVRVIFDGDVPALYSWGEPPGDEPPVRVWAGWSPTPEVQETEKIGHSVALLRFGSANDAATQDPSAVTRAMDGLVRWSTTASPAEAIVDLRTEQIPSASSRVTLGRRRDATGLRRLRLDWQRSAFDERTARRTVELLAAEFGRAGVGRVEVDPRGAPFKDVPVEIGCHPMGAARMGEDPSASVVDADLRTHDLDNLHVCSSAVFPTSGHANPTLTIVALAHRLAHHLTG